MLTREEYIYNQLLRVSAFIIMLVAIIFLAYIFIARMECLKLVAAIVSGIMIILTTLMCGILFVGLIYLFKIK